MNRSGKKFATVKDKLDDLYKNAELLMRQSTEPHIFKLKVGIWCSKKYSNMAKRAAMLKQNVIAAWEIWAVAIGLAFRGTVLLAPPPKFF